jgi:hypothetical protein
LALSCFALQIHVAESWRLIVDCQSAPTGKSC